MLEKIKEAIMTKKPPKLLPYKKLHLDIPQKFILGCLKAYDISYKDKIKILRKKKEIEVLKNRLRSVESIVEKVINKHTDNISSRLA